MPRVFAMQYLSLQFFALYGIFTLPLVLGPGVTDLYYTIGATDFAYVLLMAIIGGGAAVAGYRLPGRLTPPPEIGRMPISLPFLAIAALDMTIRMQRIASGEYFSWMRRVLWRGGNTQLSPLEMLQLGMSPILIALAIYFYSRTRSRSVLIYIVALIALVFLEGKRTSIALFVLSGILAFLLQRKDPRSFFFDRTIPLGRLVLAGALLVMSFSMVIEMRQYFRANFEVGRSSPASFLMQMTGDVIMANLGLADADYREVNVKGAQFESRSASWGLTFATAIAAHAEGQAEMLGAASFFEEMAETVPSALWIGEKPVVFSGQKMALFAEHLSGADPATSALVSIFIHFGTIGVLVMMLIVGSVIRVMTDWIMRLWGRAGQALILGATGFLSVSGNSFTSMVTGLRNFLILVIIMLIVAMVQTFIQPRRSANVQRVG